MKAIDDAAELEGRARRRVEARERFRALGLFDRPDTTWEAGLPSAEPGLPELPLRRLGG